MSRLQPVLARVAFVALGRSLRVSTTQIRINPSNQNTNLPKTFSYNFYRTYCNNKMADRVVTYEDVVTYKDKPEVMLIDVREPNELKETGVIPASINIPLGDVVNVLQNAKPEDFKSKYGRDFPKKDMELVFSCKLGGRASKAMDAAIALGFTNSKFYKGSWTDWANHQQ